MRVPCHIAREILQSAAFQTQPTLLSAREAEELSRWRFMGVQEAMGAIGAGEVGVMRMGKVEVEEAVEWGATGEAGGDVLTSRIFGCSLSASFLAGYAVQAAIIGCKSCT